MRRRSPPRHRSRTPPPRAPQPRGFRVPGGGHLGRGGRPARGTPENRPTGPRVGPAAARAAPRESRHAPPRRRNTPAAHPDRRGEPHVPTQEVPQPRSPYGPLECSSPQDRHLWVAGVRGHRVLAEHLQPDDRPSTEPTSGVGESGRADKIIEHAFDLENEGLGEFVVVQSDTLTVDDPAFRSTVDEVDGARSAPSTRSPRSSLRSTAEHAGQISPDRHAAMITVHAARRLTRGRRSTSTTSPTRSRRCRRTTPTWSSPRPASPPKRSSTSSSSRSSHGPA